MSVQMYTMTIIKSFIYVYVPKFTTTIIFLQSIYDVMNSLWELHGRTQKSQNMKFTYQPDGYPYQAPRSLGTWQKVAVILGIYFSKNTFWISIYMTWLFWNVLRLFIRDMMDYKLTLFRLMIHSCQTDWCWPSSMSTYSFTRVQIVTCYIGAIWNPNLRLIANLYISNFRCKCSYKRKKEIRQITG